MSSATFMDDALSGRAGVTDIEDYIDAWHDSTGNEELHTFLGFSWDEYRLWVEKPQSLRFIIAAHRHGLSVSDELRRSIPESYTLAARAESSSEAKGVLSWLEQTGRL